MPGLTPNRGYPYSLPADPFDIPADIEALAEAIDLDMQLLDDTVVRRPIARVSSRGTEKQLFPVDVVTECTFDFVDIDNAGISDLSIRPTRLTPTSPGLWLVWGAIEAPAAPARLHDVFLRFNGGDLTRSGYHVNDPGGFSGRMTTLAAMAFMNGTSDYFTMSFEPDVAFEQFRIGNKHLGCLRLTQF